jgi:hypothetical protein
MTFIDNTVAPQKAVRRDHYSHKSLKEKGGVPHPASFPNLHYFFFVVFFVAVFFFAFFFAPHREPHAILHHPLPCHTI